MGGRGGWDFYNGTDRPGARRGGLEARRRSRLERNVMSPWSPLQLSPVQAASDEIAPPPLAPHPSSARSSSGPVVELGGRPTHWQATPTTHCTPSPAQPHPIAPAWRTHALPGGWTRRRR